MHGWLVLKDDVLKHCLRQRSVEMSEQDSISRLQPHNQLTVDDWQGSVRSANKHIKTPLFRTSATTLCVGHPPCQQKEITQGCHSWSSRPSLATLLKMLSKVTHPFNWSDPDGYRCHPARPCRPIAHRPLGKGLARVLGPQIRIFPN